MPNIKRKDINLEYKINNGAPRPDAHPVPLVWEEACIQAVHTPGCWGTSFNKCDEVPPNSQRHGRRGA